MNSISPFVNNAMNIATQVLKAGAQQIGRWANHSVRFIQLIPQQMQQNPNVAIAVVATVNAAFFFAIHFIVNRLDKRLENQSMPLTDEQRTIKHILLNGVILGGSVISANLLLSKATQYPLNKSLVAAIATAAIMSRILLNQVGKYLARSEKDVDQEVTQIASPQKVVKGKETEKTQETEEKPVVEDQKQTQIDEPTVEDKTSKQTEETKEKPVVEDQKQTQIDEPTVEDKTSKQTEETKEKPVVEDQKQTQIDELAVEDKTSKQTEETEEQLTTENPVKDEKQITEEQQQEHVETIDEKFIDIEEDSFSEDERDIEQQPKEEAQVEFNEEQKKKASEEQLLNEQDWQLEEDSDLTSESGDNHSETDELLSGEDLDMWRMFDLEDPFFTNFTDQDQVKDQAEPSLDEDTLDIYNQDFTKTQDQGKEEESEKVQQPSHQIVVIKPKASAVIATPKDEKVDPALVQEMYAQFIKNHPPLYSTSLQPSLIEKLEKKKKKEEKSSVIPYQPTQLGQGSGTLGNALWYSRWKALNPSSKFINPILWPTTFVGMGLLPHMFLTHNKTTAKSFFAVQDPTIKE